MYLFCILLLPLLAAAITVLLPRRYDVNSLSATVILWILVLLSVVSLSLDVHTMRLHWHYFSAGDHIVFDLGFRLDHFAKLLLVFISLLAVVIYRYADRYLRGDLSRCRFLGQLCLAVFSTIILVTADNLLTAFVAWQLIGLSIYLLLNHYHYDLQANRAAKKKFVINRLGDTTFLFAIMLAYHDVGSTQFSQLVHAPHLTLIALLVFIAVMTKSAQFPFHIWLPDTMEAPTPVSAFMHAGVINAGGILLTRLSAMLLHSSVMMVFILCVGLISAILAAIFAQGQFDVKKKLAYSTMGQMGYMLVQVGSGAFLAAIFHLIAHGFYKATLFLSAGDTLQRPPENPPVKAPAVWGYLGGVALLGVGLAYSHFIDLHLPWLIWTFLLMTVCYSFNRTQQFAHNKWTAVVVLCLLFLVYMTVLRLVDGFLHHYDYVVLNTGLLQYLLSAVVVVLYLLQQHVVGKGKLYQVPRKLQHIFCEEKLYIEPLYRSLWLRPLRMVGEWFNVHLAKKNRMHCLGGVSILSTGILIVITMLLPHASGSIGWLTLCLCYAVLAFVMANIILNRCHHLQYALLWIAISQFYFVLIGASSVNGVMQQVSMLYLVNLLLLLLMFHLLLRQNRPLQRRPSASVMVRTNQLSLKLFYLSSGLLLLIGVPGTVSFLAEITYLESLVQAHLVLAILFAIGMIALAIAVMHALQLYVFTSKQPRVVQQQLMLWEHICCVVIIALNIVSGVNPQAIFSLVRGH